MPNARLGDACCHRCVSIGWRREDSGTTRKGGLSCSETLPFFSPPQPFQPGDGCALEVDFWTHVRHMVIVAWLSNGYLSTLDFDAALNVAPRGNDFLFACRRLSCDGTVYDLRRRLLIFDYDQVHLSLSRPPSVVVAAHLPSAAVLQPQQADDLALGGCAGPALGEDL